MEGIRRALGYTDIETQKATDKAWRPGQVTQGADYENRPTPEAAEQRAKQAACECTDAGIGDDTALQLDELAAEGGQAEAERQQL